jgi:hypothetical protein
MEGNNESGNDARGKRIGTREEVFKGLAARTAGGLTKADIIAKQFGTRTLYISKRLSDRMRENFQHANYFRKRVRKTLVATNNTPAPQQTMQDTMIKPVSTGGGVKAHHAKTLKFKVNDNTVRNVYYKELQGQNLQKLKEELKKEEAEEDMGLPALRESNSGGEFKIEDVPEISLDDLE